MLLPYQDFCLSQEDKFRIKRLISIIKTKDMNSKKSKFFLPVLILCGAIISGCEQDGLWEIFPFSENAVIQNEVDGIEFKFCLLNEAGEAATVFKKVRISRFFFI
jgi:hypothetical protein